MYVQEERERERGERERERACEYVCVCLCVCVCVSEWGITYLCVVGRESSTIGSEMV